MALSEGRKSRLKGSAKEHTVTLSREIVRAKEVLNANARTDSPL